MAANPPQTSQRLIPYLAYSDAPAALAFLSRAFGFEEKFRFPMPDGRIGHAELTLDGQVVLMLASVYPEMGFASPADLEGVPMSVSPTMTRVGQLIAFDVFRRKLEWLDSPRLH